MGSCQINDDLSTFWSHLRMLGINVQRDHEKNKESFLMKSYKLFVILVMVLALISKCLITDEWSTPLTIYKASGIIQVVAVEFMYFKILSSKRKLSIVRKLVNVFPVRKKSNTFFSLMNILVRLSIFIMVFFPIWLYLTDVQRLFNVTKVRFENWNLKIAFSIIYLLANSLLLTVAPAIFASLFCAICYQWKETLCFVKNDIQRARKCFTDPHGMYVAMNSLQNCRLLWNGTNVIKNAFSTFLLFFIVKNISVIFLLSCVIIGTVTFNRDTVSVIFVLAGEIFYFTSTVYLASRIPEEMDDILMILNEIREDMPVGRRDEKQQLIRMQLKLSASKKVIVLSVGGWADLRKSLILNVIGNLITYGLIMIQLQQQNNIKD